MRSRWPVRGVAAAAMWLLAVGCDDPAGVLIEVTRDDSVPAELRRIELHIGTAGILGLPSRFVDPAPQPDVRIDGRDLAVDPYRLLVRPRDHPDANLMVAVVAYQSGEVVGFGALDQPVRFVDGEVTMWRVVLRGQLPDGLGTTETGCLTWVDESGGRMAIGKPGDKDCDGWRDRDDCNDLDPRVNPGAGELCGNDVDEDCDGEADEDVDEDGDLVTTCQGDCNDGDAAVSPDAAERCDGVDNDCNGLCDEGQDADGDDHTACGSQIIDGGSACVFEPGLADCDEGRGDINPGAAEVCDGIDNDCDQVCDNREAGLDRDGDGFTACGSIAGHCGLSELYRDCQDEDGAIFPGAAELCNGLDDDCDGQLLQRGPCFGIDPESTLCFLGGRECAEQPGRAGDWAAACSPIPDPVFHLVPDALCATYDSCDQADDPDPHTCSIESDASGLAVTRCAVSYDVASGDQCARPEVALPTGQLELCSWIVVGGVEQGDYLVGLRPVDLPDETPQPALDVCGAVLVVTPREPGRPASPHTVLLARTDDLFFTEYLAVSLASSPVDGCEPPSGLECADFPLQ